MTTQNNNIQTLESENKFFVHLNRLLVVSIIAYALLLDGYQTTDKFFVISTVIWLWESELRIVEIKIARRASIKQLLIVFITASMVIAIFMVLKAFVDISQWFPNYEIWLLLAVFLMGVFSLVFKPLVWLVTNNPVQNIDKGYRNEGALK